MSHYTTKFASLQYYEKGHVDVIKDDIKRYAFSNIFEVAKNSEPYEKIIVAKNLEYIVEVSKAQGQSHYYIASHDQFMLVMDGSLKVEFFLSKEPDKVYSSAGAEIIATSCLDKKIGTIMATRGHLVLLSKNIIYQFQAKNGAVFLLQTLHGKHSIEKWSDICLS